MSAVVVVLGCGFTGTAAAHLARAAGAHVVATTRDPLRAESLRAEGFEAHCLAALHGDVVRRLVPEGARVLATFPPDGRTDAAVTAALPPCRCVYVSTTGVYGDRRGDIDAATPVDPSAPKAAARLEAEALWRACGAVVLRAAGIYGPGRGLHRRIAQGTFRLPEDGSRVVSRIHVDDLAALCLAALDRGAQGATWPVADDTPVPQGEVVRWLVERLGVPMPPRAALGDVPETLRHDRSVRNAEAVRALGVTLRYPSWREGFEACLAAEGRDTTRAR